MAAQRKYPEELREFNGEEDHVHLLVQYGAVPKVAVSALVNSLKGVPARRLRSEFTGRASGTGTSGPRPTSARPAAGRR